MDSDEGGLEVGTLVYPGRSSSASSSELDLEEIEDAEQGVKLVREGDVVAEELLTGEREAGVSCQASRRLLRSASSPYQPPPLEAGDLAAS